VEKKEFPAQIGGKVQKSYPFVGEKTQVNPCKIPMNQPRGEEKALLLALLLEC
jgi:hypothetical protein